MQPVTQIDPRVSQSALGELRVGWRFIVAALIGISFGVTGLFFYSAGIFLKPLAAEFGWSRTVLSSVSMIAALTLAATAPFVGWFADRFGARIIVLAAGLGLAIGFFALSHTPGDFTLFIALIVLTVLLGAGAGPVVFTRLVNQNFDKARGTALGLAQMATGMAGALLPPLLVPYIATHGWREGYLALAVASLLSLPVVLLLMGRPRQPAVAARATAAPVGGMSLREATRGRVFWWLVAVLVFAAVGVGGMIVHLVPMLSDAGLTPLRAGAIASSMGVSIMVGRAVTGMLVDRIFAPRVAFAAFGLAACGCWLLSLGGASWALLSASLAGLAMGAEVDLISYFVARYFGLAAYGSIYGWLYALFMVGTSIGPLIAGTAFDRFGNYNIALAVLGTSLAIAALATFGLARFPDQEHS